MGTIIVWLGLVALTILFFVLDSTSQKDFSSLCMLFFFICLFGLVPLTILITSRAVNPECVTNTEVVSTKIVPVNDYYLYKGQYILENNERGEYSDISISINDLSSSKHIYEIRTIKHIRANFLHFAGKIESTNLVIKE